MLEMQTYRDLRPKLIELLMYAVCLLLGEQNSSNTVTLLSTESNWFNATLAVSTAEEHVAMIVPSWFHDKSVKSFGLDCWNDNTAAPSRSGVDAALIDRSMDFRWSHRVTTAPQLIANIDWVGKFNTYYEECRNCGFNSFHRGALDFTMSSLGLKIIQILKYS